MRRSGILFFVLLMLSVPSEGGDYHVTDKMICSDCHSMHFSEQHTYEGAFGGGTPPLSGGPNPFLLRQPESDLCLSCHDGKDFAPDIKGINSNDTYVRAAGALTTGSGDYTTGNGHTMGSTDAPPNSSMSGYADGLLCKHCHNIHGNDNYRNLVKRPGIATADITVTYKAGSYNPDNDSQAIQQSSASPMSTHYAVGNIKYRMHLQGSNYGLSKWCRGCHDSYSGTQGCRYDDPPDTMAQAVTDVKVPGNSWWFSTTNPLNSRIPVMSLSGTIPNTSGSSDNRPFCGTCHKAHGSTHVDGQIWDDGTTTNPEDESSTTTTIDNTCDQCHTAE